MILQPEKGAKLGHPRPSLPRCNPTDRSPVLQDQPHLETNEKDNVILMMRSFRFAPCIRIIPVASRLKIPWFEKGSGSQEFWRDLFPSLHLIDEIDDIVSNKSQKKT